MTGLVAGSKKAKEAGRKAAETRAKNKEKTVHKFSLLKEKKDIICELMREGFVLADIQTYLEKKYNFSITYEQFSKHIKNARMLGIIPKHLKIQKVCSCGFKWEVKPMYGKYWCNCPRCLKKHPIFKTTVKTRSELKIEVVTPTKSAVSTKEKEKLVEKQYDGRGKTEFRQKLIDVMYQHGVAWGTIVSLETAQWRFNKLIPGKHIHYQWDPNEAKEMEITKPEDTYIFHKDIKHLPEDRIPLIDGLWLDYMGTYDKHEEEIESIVHAKSMKLCKVIGLTISPRSVGKNKERVLQADRILTSMSEIFGNYDRHPIYPYKDGAPMWGIIFVNKDCCDLQSEADSIYGRIVPNGCGDKENRTGPFYSGYYPADSRYNGYGHFRIHKEGYSDTTYNLQYILSHKNNFQPDYRIPDRRHQSNFKLLSTFLNSFVSPRDINDCYDMGTSKAGFRRFISEFKDMIVIPINRNEVEKYSDSKFVLKPNLNLLEEYGWDICGKILRTL